VRVRRRVFVLIRGWRSELLAPWTLLSPFPHRVIGPGAVELILESYYNVTVNGKEIKDAVWYYRYPTAESAVVAGRLCFYNEKVDVFVDGVKEEK
jgi:hypothetical protein